MIKIRADFKLIDNPRGQSLLYRGSHVMSMPTDQDDLQKRLASMDEAGIDMAILSVGALNIGWAGSGDAAAARLSTTGSPRFAGNIQVVFASSLSCRARSLTKWCESWIALSVWARPASASQPISVTFSYTHPSCENSGRR